MDATYIIIILIFTLLAVGISAATVHLTTSDARLGRGAYAGRMAFSFLLAVALRALVKAMPLGSVLAFMVSVVFLVYVTRCTVFRCADAGLSRKLAIPVGIPLLGLLVPLVLIFAASKPSANSDSDTDSSFGETAPFPTPHRTQQSD